jgi:hydrogenase/urease accessory protein HupE
MDHGSIVLNAGFAIDHGCVHTKSACELDKKQFTYFFSFSIAKYSINNLLFY